MSRLALLFIALPAVLLPLLVQSCQNDRLSEKLKVQSEAMGELQAQSRGLKTALQEIMASQKEDNTLVASTAQRVEALEGASRHLDKKLKEALRHAENYKADASLGAAATRLLCLRYLAADGRLPADYPADAPAGAHAGKADSVAAFCAAWPELTTQDALEWLTLLLDHAGRQQLDKAALSAHGARAAQKAGKEALNGR